MKFFLYCLLLLSFFGPAFASNVGIVVKKEGKVELFTNPSKTIKKNEKNKILYEGTYYTLKKVRPGTRIKNNNILRTGSKSKAKIVYKNGDQFNIGEGTSYKIHWAKKGRKEEAPDVSLIYGSLRGIISKKGPRKGMKVQSRNAVMGVRGTDFHFYQKGTSGKSSIAVIRGKVEVANKPKSKKEKLKFMPVKQGMTCEVITQKKEGKKVEATSTLTMEKTNQVDLVAIQQNSTIKAKKEEKVSPKVQKELKELEEKATKVTLDDIKDYQPEIYKELQKKKVKSVDDINTTVVKKAFKKAPKTKKKQAFDDIDFKLEEDAYKKYFKVDSI